MCCFLNASAIASTGLQKCFQRSLEKYNPTNLPFQDKVPFTQVLCIGTFSECMHRAVCVNRNVTHFSQAIPCQLPSTKSRSTTYANTASYCLECHKAEKCAIFSVPLLQMYTWTHKHLDILNCLHQSSAKHYPEYLTALSLLPQ